jgi:diaminopimelate decarboxylase
LDSGEWPRGARFEADGEISVAGVRLSLLVAAYGTPALVLDEDDVRYRCRNCLAALPGTEIAYAGEAFLCRAMAQWIAAEGLSLAVSSAGELAVAQAVNFPAERIILHGNAKTPADLRAALRYGVDRIVVESSAEIIRLAALTPRLQRVLIQVTPGVDGDRSAPASAEDRESGFSLRSGAAGDAVRRVLSHPELTLTGLRCHLAGQPAGPSAFAPSSLDAAVRELLGLTAAVREHTGVTLTELSLGGGRLAPPVTGEDDVGLVNFADRLRRLVASECAQLRLPVPHLVIEPGRVIVDRAMITLYRVLGVKHSAGGRAFVTVDGAMSDYQYPDPYGGSHLVHAVRPSRAPSGPATVVGRHSEEGSLPGSDGTLPADLRPGDVIAVPSTGAYNHSMASDHDLAGRPPVIAVSNGESRTLIRKETASDLLIRDIGLLKGEFGAPYALRSCADKRRWLPHAADRAA